MIGKKNYSNVYQQTERQSTCRGCAGWGLISLSEIPSVIFLSASEDAYAHLPHPQPGKTACEQILFRGNK